MKIPVLKKNDKGYIELPDELANLANIEIFALRQGYYLLSAQLENIAPVPLGQNQNRQAAVVLNGEEKSMLGKMLGIKFKDRTPKLLEKSLSQRELETLEKLIEKKYINVFKSVKYPDGVYNIADSVYPMSREPNVPVSFPLVQEKNTITPRVAQNPVQRTAQAPLKTVSMQSSDYIIIANPQEAREFSEFNRDRIKGGEIIATRGFDSKFYAIKKNYYLRTLPKVRELLENADSNLETISKSLGIENDAAKAVMVTMSEKGEVIEKKKGLFSLI